MKTVKGEMDGVGLFAAGVLRRKKGRVTRRVKAMAAGREWRYVR